MGGVIVAIASRLFNNMEADCPVKTEVLYTIAVPAYNEEEALPVVLSKIFDLLGNDDLFEVLVVNDGSTDGTAEVALSFPCRLISHTTNLGKGEAMKTAVRNARGRNIIFTDADDTYPPDAILDIARDLDRYDMVIASRFYGQENIPPLNRFGNAVFRKLIQGIYGFTAYDPLTGMKGIKKEYISKMDLKPKGFGIGVDICIKATLMKLSIKDIHIHYQPRIGQTKMRIVSGTYRILSVIIANIGPRLAQIVQKE